MGLKRCRRLQRGPNHAGPGGEEEAGGSTTSFAGQVLALAGEEVFGDYFTYRFRLFAPRPERPDRGGGGGGGGGPKCAPGYSPCLPIVPDLDCGQIPDDKKPIRVTGNDQYGLDVDGDGVGCET